jgi:hypothetical protein
MDYLPGYFPAKTDDHQVNLDKNLQPGNLTGALDSGLSSA